MSLSPTTGPLGSHSPGLPSSSPLGHSTSEPHINNSYDLNRSSSPFPPSPNSSTYLPVNQSSASVNHLAHLSPGPSQANRSASNTPSPSPWPPGQGPPPPPPPGYIDHPAGPTQLFVSNLPFRVRWQDMKDLFRKCGNVLRADVALTPMDGRSRGFGVVLFARREDAFKAIDAYHGFTWQTRVLDVKLDTQDPTGALAMAEASRQAALQQQAQQFSLNPQQQHWPGQLPVPGPGPMGMAFQGGGGGLPPPLNGPSPRIAAAASPVPSLAPALHQSPPPPGASPAFGHDTLKASTPEAPSAQQSPPILNGTLPPVQLSPPTERPPRGLSPAPSDHSHHPQQGNIGPQHNLNGAANTMMNGPSHLGMHPMGPPGGAYQLFPGGPGPMGPPGGMGMMGPQRSISGQGSPFPPNRHLFVGNLPFNCQWQELKDLFRGAGAVARADIAQGPDGRSRGFGNVVFQNAIDAERAVHMFNGYDYHGRALKVHLDKFSGQGGGQPAPPGFPANPHQPPPQFMGGYPEPPRGGLQQQMWQSMAPSRGYDGPSQQNRPGSRPASRNGFEYGDRGRPDDRPRESGLHIQTNLGRPVSASAPGEGQHRTDHHANDDGANKGEHPSRIAMPPPFPFAGPLSPLTGRLPPMTPSMPAFTLGAFPQTPPIHPSFFSPGIGPMSPGLSSPFFGVGGFHFGGNAAIGEPVHSSFGAFGGHLRFDTAGTPMGEFGQAEAEATPSAEKANGAQDEPGYFPPVAASEAGAEHVTTPKLSFDAPPANGNGTTHSAPPMSPQHSSRPDLPTQSKSDTLAAGLAQLGLADGAADSGVPAFDGSAEGWATSGLGLGPAVADERARRRSFVAGGAGGLQAEEAAAKAAAGEGKDRRASFEAGGRARPQFGESIW